MNAPKCPTCGRPLGASDIGMGICVKCGALLAGVVDLWDHQAETGQGAPAA